MSVLETLPATEWSDKLDGIIQQVKDTIINIALPFMIVIGLIFLGSSSQFQDSLINLTIGLLAFGFGLAIWFLRKRSYLLASLILILGCLGIDLLAVIWGGLEPAIFLLVVPVGIATLLIDTSVGVILAALCSLLLMFTPLSILPVHQSTRFITGVGLWSILGIIRLTTQPLFTAFQWAWYGYERNEGLLKQSRDYQLQLHDALEDLTAANVHLTRLNRLTDGLRHEAEEARIIKTEFVAKVSHELRTPLNMILGFSRMIVDAPQTYGKRLPPALLSDLEIILRNSEHLSGLIDDVLDLSQLEAGQMALVRERASLLEIIQAAISAVQPLYKLKGLYLKLNAPHDLPLVYCDRTRIREVVLNLLSNAGRYTEVGGVEINVVPDIQFITVSIMDTGPGIDLQNADHLFEPFHQLDNSFRRKFGGNGLGLSISKNFIELHKGKIWFESLPGVNTTFFFTLPINPAETAEGNPNRWINPEWTNLHHSLRPNPPSPIIRPRFVILERGKMFQHLLKRYMDNPDISTATDFEQAISELSRTPSQALLINSYSLNESLNFLNSSKMMIYGTPAFICSVPDTYEAAHEMGASDYLIKPFTRDHLLDILKKMQLKGNTILVVDDEQDALRMIKRMLSSTDLGYRVLTASDGVEALEVMHQQPPDAILLDLAMPKMDGFEFLAIKKEDAAFSNIPVIIISARDPAGQPIVSNSITITRAGGLSLTQLLKCIETFSSVLSPFSPLPDSEPTTILRE